MLNFCNVGKEHFLQFNWHHRFFKLFYSSAVRLRRRLTKKNGVTMLKCEINVVKVYLVAILNHRTQLLQQPLMHFLIQQFLILSTPNNKLKAILASDFVFQCIILHFKPEVSNFPKTLWSQPKTAAMRSKMLYCWVYFKGYKHQYQAYHDLQHLVFCLKKDKNVNT